MDLDQGSESGSGSGSGSEAAEAAESEYDTEELEDGGQQNVPADDPDSDEDEDEDEEDVLVAVNPVLAAGAQSVVSGHLAHLQRKKRVKVRHISVDVRDDAYGLSLDVTVPLLDRFDYADRLDIRSWYVDKSIYNLGIRVETSPNLNLTDYESAGVLDISRATSEQVVRIRGAIFITKIQVGRHTTELYVKGAPALANIGASGTGTPLLSKLVLERCASLRLDDMHLLANLTSLCIKKCSFKGPLNPIYRLRSSLRHLVFWKSSTDHAPDGFTLRFSDFPHLETLSIGFIDTLLEMTIQDCPKLAELEVVVCEELSSLRFTDGQGPAIIRGFTRLTSLTLCSIKLPCLVLADLPALDRVQLSSNDMADLIIDGDTCPVLSNLMISHNSKLAVESCHLKGKFPNLKELVICQMDFENLWDLPLQWDLTALEVLVINRTLIEATMDLSACTHLRRIDLAHNRLGGLRDRSLQPYKLRVRVGPGPLPKLLGHNVLLISASEVIPENELVFVRPSSVRAFLNVGWHA